MCEYLFLLVLFQNVTYHCTALSAVLDWIYALQVFIIIVLAVSLMVHWAQNTS